MCSPSSDPHETLQPQLSKTAQNKLHQPSVEETPHFEAPSAQIKYQGWTPGFSAFQTRSSERMPPPYSRPGLLNFSELAETRIRQIIHISEEFWDENGGKGREVGSEIFGRFFENHDSSLLT